MVLAAGGPSNIITRRPTTPAEVVATAALPIELSPIAQLKSASLTL
jgi:hypothetical protein